MRWRRANAGFYLKEVRNDRPLLPAAHGEDHVFHLFVLRTARRDALLRRLSEAGIGYAIHYPVPPHRQEAYRDMRRLHLPITEELSREVLSIPSGVTLSEDDRGRTVEVLNAFR
jgi:dTDP-4-amino-4,6-dideoxygalactose transaminase